MAHLFKLPTFSDARGSLTILEKELPFSIQRVYWIYGADGSTRGGHRHIETVQALFCIHGRCTVRVVCHQQEQLFDLTQANEGLLLEPEDWHELMPSEHGVVLLVASHVYNAEDYEKDPLP